MKSQAPSTTASAAFAALLLTAVFTSTAAAQTDEIKLANPAGTAGARFGASVDLSGDVIIVGAPDGDHPFYAAGTGTAVVARLVGSTWVPDVFPPDHSGVLAESLVPGDSFGHAVAILGDTAVVGAPFFSGLGAPSHGAVFIYEFAAGSWSCVDVLESDGEADVEFGTSVAMAGDMLVVGEPRGPVNPGTGVVRVYRESVGWLLDDSLFYGGGVVGDRFGEAVAVTNVNRDAVNVGAPFFDSFFPDNGVAVQFVHDGISTWDEVSSWSWVEEDALTGQSVAIHGDNAAHGTPDGFGGLGAAGFLRWNGTFYDADSGWTSWVAGDEYGAAVAIFGDRASVGITSWDGTSGLRPDSGAFYVFTDGGTVWDASDAIFPYAMDVEGGDAYGSALAMDGDLVIVGSPGDDDAGLDAGAIYTYDTQLRSWEWDYVGNGLPGTYGEPLLVGEGPLEGGTPVRFVLQGALESAPAFFGVGLPLFAPFKGGIMVPDVAGAGGLLVPMLTGIDGTIEINSTWPLGVPSGFPTYYQMWITDPAGPVGFAASNAFFGSTP